MYIVNEQGWKETSEPTRRCDIKYFLNCSYLSFDTCVFNVRYFSNWEAGVRPLVIKTQVMHVLAYDPMKHCH